MKQLLLFIVLLLAIAGKSQSIFIKKGNIEFERKTNTYRLYFSGEEGSFWEEFKKSIPHATYKADGDTFSAFMQSIVGNRERLFHTQQ